MALDYAGQSNGPGMEQNDPVAVEVCRKYQDAKALKAPLEADWRNVALYGLPRHYSGWVSTNAPQQTAGSGASRTARIAAFDSTLARAIPIYAAVLERMLTPSTQTYHTLAAEDLRLMRNRQVKLGFERLNDWLFAKRYDPWAGFASTQGEVYQSYGAYGNAGKMITWRHAKDHTSRRSGFLYRHIPFRNLYWNVDDEEQINDKWRRIDWTPMQALMALKDKCPKKLAEIAKGPSTSTDYTRTYEFFQYIGPTQWFDPKALDWRRFPWVSLYCYVPEPQFVVEPSGYRSNPLVTPRHFTEGGMPYGYGAAQSVLSAVGSVNAQKKTMLKQGQKAVDPPLLTRDDGVMNGNVDLTPGSLNPGGIDNQGRKMVQPIEMGNWQIAEKMIATEQDDIREALFGRVFEMLKDRPQMTATEVLDIAAREGALIAPTMGRCQETDLGPHVEREIELLAENNALPPDLPAELSNIDYKTVYTSPLAKSLHAESVSGFMRISDMAMNVAKMTGDKKPLYRLNYDVALPAIAEQQSVPPSWMRGDEEVAAMVKTDGEEARAQQMIDAAPAIAAVAKTRQGTGTEPAPVPPAGQVVQ